MIKSPDDKAPLVEHLIELRNRLLRAVLAVLVGFLVCYTVAESIYDVLLYPLRSVAGAEVKLIYTGLQEAFITYLKVAFYAGAFLAAPYAIWQIWMFVAPGLYLRERRAVAPLLIAVPVLFFAGGAFAYGLVLPLAFQYFLSFSTNTIESMPRVAEYLSLVVTLMFAFGLTFEMPVVLMLLIKVGVVSTRALIDKRRYATVAMAIFAAVVTPPDPISMLLMLAPLLAMYEVAILGGKWIERGRPTPDRQSDEDQVFPETAADAPDFDDLAADALAADALDQRSNQP